jgi:hypothetical protein
MAKATVKEIKPVQAKLESVTLELSPEEALVVLSLLGKVNPALYGLKSLHSGSTFSALNEALKLNYGDPYGLSPLKKRIDRVTRATGIDIRSALPTSRDEGFWPFP